MLCYLLMSDRRAYDGQTVLLEWRARGNRGMSQVLAYEAELNDRPHAREILV